MAGRSLTPTQQEVLDRIRLPVEDRPEWPIETRAELRTRLHDEMAGAAALIPDDQRLWVSKAGLDAVHGCEVRWLNDVFEWSVPTARGRIAHKAIELTVSWKGDPTAAELVEEAVARVSEGNDGLADWLQTCGEGTRTELRGQATAAVDGFLNSFPPLTRGFKPTAEVSRSALFHDDRILLQGRFDLTVGVPDGTRSGRVIIEIKTGAPGIGHREDLRFYALLETLQSGVPPMLVANFYPESGRIDPELVTEDLLEAAVRRTISGANRLAQLQYGPSPEPQRRPGPPCRWCPVSADCEPGRAFLDDDTW
jgi:hypothetical protein